MILTAINRVLEKSTQYYYFLPSYTRNNIDAEKWIQKYLKGKDKNNLSAKEISHVEKTFESNNWLNTNEEIEKPLPKMKFPKGTLVVVQGYGDESDPKKQIWNGTIGEIRDINHKGEYTIRVTDIKHSKVLFSKKWAGREQDALKYILHLSPENFVTVNEYEKDTDSLRVKGR